MDSQQLDHKKTTSWALYDLANTLYSAAIVTLFLPLYVTSITEWKASLGLTASLVMILAGVFSPAMGAVADRTGKTKFYLLISTCLTCFFTAFLGLSSQLIWLLVFFSVAHFSFLLSLVFYNSLLPVVSPPEKQGWVSGVGTGLGYTGVLLALPLAYLVQNYLGTRFVFPMVGIFYFLAAIPLFMNVPERRVTNPEPFSFKDVSKYFKEVTHTLLEIPHHKKVFYFFVAHFFILEAMNAVILWLSVFLKFTFGLEQGSVILILIGSNLAAAIFGFTLAFITDRVGAFKILFFSALSLWICLIILTIAPNPIIALSSVILFGSFSFAGIWTSGRKYLIQISPKEKIGEFFGIYGMTTKLSCFSMALFALIADQFNFRIAILELIVVLTVGIILLLKANNQK